MYVCVNVRMLYMFNRVIQSKLMCNLVKVIKRQATIQYKLMMDVFEVFIKLP